VIDGNASIEPSHALTGGARFEGSYRETTAFSSYGHGSYAQAGGFDPVGIDFEAVPGGGVVLTFSPAAVPEPTSVLLTLAGPGLLGGVVARRRRSLETTNPDQPAGGAKPGSGQSLM
jgi:hypothetical protein